MKELTEKNIITRLNRYCFDQIWNAPFSEYRTNHNTLAINRGHSYTGYCYLGDKPLTLPTNKTSFHVYKVNKSNIHGLNAIPQDMWLRGDQLVNEENLIFHLLTESGLMINKGAFYIKVKSDIDIVTIAIDKKFIKKTSIEEADIRITTYIDNNCTVYIDNALDIIYNNVEDRHKLSCYLNGSYLDADIALSSISEDDHFEVILDNSIISETTIPVTTSTNTYHSERDSLYKEIIHIPKVCNPDNHIITPNSCDIYIRNDDTGEGYFLYYKKDHTVGQITHNDFSIPRYVIDSYKDKMSASDISIHIKVRTYDKAQYLTNNGSYIDILYTHHSDEEIIKHLKGELSPDLDFWRASNLEELPYIDMMRDVPNTIEEANLDYYVSALGYYNTISLLTKRVYSYQGSTLASKEIIIEPPLIWRNEKVYPLVYKNGNKIKDEYVYYKNYPDNSYLHVQISSDIHIANSDIVTIVIFPIGNNTTHEIVPNEDNNEITISNNFSFKIFEEVEHDLPIKGMYKESYKSYRPIVPELNNIRVSDMGNGTTTIRFNNNFYDKRMIIQYESFTRRMYKNLDSQIDNNENLIISIEDESGFPILNYKSVDLYFNNRYLVEGIDFKVAKLTDNEGNISMIDIAIQSLEYGYDNHSNEAEAIISTIPSTNCDIGYVLDDKISRDPDVDIYFSGISLIHINGLFENNVSNYGSYLIINDDIYDNGNVFELKTPIPEVIVSKIPSYLRDVDNHRIQVITEYLDHNYIDENTTVIVENTHNVMSSYFNYLFTGILDGTIKLSYDPDDISMVNQTKIYDHLKEYDLIFSEDSSIDLRFVDIMPAYKDYLTDNTEAKKIVLRLFDLMLPTDNFRSGATINEQ